LAILPTGIKQTL